MWAALTLYHNAGHQQGGSHQRISAKVSHLCTSAIREDPEFFSLQIWAGTEGSTPEGLESKAPVGTQLLVFRNENDILTDRLPHD